MLFFIFIRSPIHPRLFPLVQSGLFMLEIDAVSGHAIIASPDIKPFICLLVCTHSSEFLFCKILGVFSII